MSTCDTTDTYTAIHAARPGEVGAAADGWRLAATRLAELRDQLAETARLGAQSWIGGGAERFTARCHALAETADRLAAQGTALHRHLTEATHALTRAQESATDRTTAQAAATRLEDVFRDLGERLSILPEPACATTPPPPSAQTTTVTTTAASPESDIDTDAYTAGTSTGAAADVPTRPCCPTTDRIPSDASPTAAGPPDRATPTPLTPLATPPVPPTPSCATQTPQPPPTPPPPAAPLTTCMAATTPPAPPDPPTLPAPPAPPPAIACTHPPAPPVVGTPLPRDPRPVHPAGIGPRPRRVAQPPASPVAPVTGIRIAPGLRTGGDQPAATHDAAHAAGPVPDLLGGTARDGTPAAPPSPTWVTTPTTPTTGGTPTTRHTRRHPDSRNTTHPTEAWWTDPEDA
ncbi:WXG100 family type VII secretion target [Embleya sp. AB8]|uniref:WXG100 family type VII secretion target n=1 Tax=Embleya sp. AB8 TaxID=3156304 RepID=UPI003C74E843